MQNQAVNQSRGSCLNLSGAAALPVPGKNFRLINKKCPRVPRRNHPPYLIIIYWKLETLYLGWMGGGGMSKSGNPWTPYNMKQINVRVEMKCLDAIPN